MLVEIKAPSRFDATMGKAMDNGLIVTPTFYSEKGTTTIALLVVSNDHNKILDRCVLAVNGSGKVTLAHKNAEVTPIADITSK